MRTGVRFAGLPPMKKFTEASFTDQVIKLAQLRGWRVHHQRPARTATGWRSAIQGHPGFPDLILIRNGALIVAELKMPKGTTTPEQGEWLKTFTSISCGRVVVWRPNDWPEIERMLA